METKTSTLTGLTSQQAAQRISEGRCNGSPPVSTKTVPQIIRENLFTLFNLINIVLAVLIASTGSYRNILFMGVVVCNLVIGIFQEVRSKRVIDRLSLISAPKAHLLRDGKELSVPTSDVVTDDIMLLNAGQQVCADGVIREGSCEVDESLVTGESEPVRKSIGDTILSGSFIVSGAAKAQATAVGASSYSGKISAGAKTAKRRTSEMMQSINKIIRVVSVCIIPFAIVLFFKAIYITQQSTDRAIISTCAALIGMIPEGLVLLTSLALAVSSIKLAKRNTLCQDLYCVEALARVDVLCLDKTGTITTGNMVVADIIPLDSSFDHERSLTKLCAASQDNNPTMAALKRNFSGAENTAIRAIPFSSARKWSAAVFANETLVLGATQYVLGEDEYLSLKPLIEQHTSRGMRVLVLAQSTEPPTDDALPQKITAKALIILSDEVRSTAAQTFEYFKKQGVEIKVISGDDPVTVSSVAKRAGLDGADKLIDCSSLTDEELSDAAAKHTIFGRVTPYQKQALVAALKSSGHKVAMTGDGVNDVLALRDADCSIAMQSGSDAARCVSQLVLLDSDFSNMPLVVEEGRRVINNIQRSAALFLVKTIFSFLLAVIFLFIPAAYPFQPIQMTLISALAIGIPSFLLTLEPDHSIVKGRFMSNVMQRAFPAGLSVALGISAVLITQWLMDLTQQQASTMSVVITACVMFSVLFNVCRPFNKLRSAMLIVLVTAFTAISILLPKLFYLEMLPVHLWEITAAISVLSVLIMHLISKLFKKTTQ